MPSDEEIAALKRSISERLKHQGFETGEVVMETDVDFTAVDLINSLLASGEKPMPVSVKVVNSPATLHIYVDGVTKVYEPHERLGVGKLPGNSDEPSWRFEGWMIEFDPDPKIVRMRGRLDESNCKVQRISEVSDAEGLVTSVVDD